MATIGSRRLDLIGAEPDDRLRPPLFGHRRPRRRARGHTEPVDVVLTGRLGELVGRGGVCVLSGAGLSTESGIPDYRGPDGALRGRLPMTIGEFRGSPQTRQRYWAAVYLSL